MFNLVNPSKFFSPSLKDHTLSYPTPITINFFYGFGFLSGILLGLQMISGILVGIYFTADASLSFESIENLMNEVRGGWFFRNLHQVGASFFFFSVYFHLGRSFYFKSYLWPNSVVWWSGILIFFLMVTTAFLGYVLPWSQMGFWAATVITNLFTAIPVIGTNLVLWIWTGFAVHNNTLKKFAILHYILPFFLAAVACLHIALLHTAGSSDSLVSSKSVEKINFYPFFIKKDLSFVCFTLFLLFLVVCLYPTIFNEVDIYTKADPLTGIYVIPEWYFLPIFGLIKCVRSKVFGIFLILLFFMLLVFCPFIVNSEACYVNSRDQDIYSFLAINVFISYVCLGVVAAQPLTEEMFVLNGLMAAWFFSSFFLIYFNEVIKKNV